MVKKAIDLFYYYGFRGVSCKMLSVMAYQQSTSDNSNLLGKSKKVRVTRPGVRVIGSSKRVTGNRKILQEMDGEEMQVSCTLHFKGNKRYRKIF